MGFFLVSDFETMISLLELTRTDFKPNYFAYWILCLCVVFYSHSKQSSKVVSTVNNLTYLVFKMMHILYIEHFIQLWMRMKWKYKYWVSLFGAKCGILISMFILKVLSINQNNYRVVWVAGKFEANFILDRLLIILLTLFLTEKHWIGLIIFKIIRLPA